MKAVLLPSWKSDPQLVEVDVPTPGPGQVVLKIAGAGLCHSDLHLLHDFEEGMLPWKVPFILGHENSGYVHAVGEGVETVARRAGRGGLRPLGLRQVRRLRTRPGHLLRRPARRLRQRVRRRPRHERRPGRVHARAGRTLPRAHPRRARPRRRGSADRRGPDAVPRGEAVRREDGAGLPRRRHRRRRARPHGHPDHQGDDGGRRRGGRREARGARARRQVRCRRGPRRQRRGHRRPDQGGHSAAAPRWSSTSWAPTPRLATAAGSCKYQSDLTLVGVGGGSFAFNLYAPPYETAMRSIYWGTRSELGEVLALAARGLITPEYTTYSLDQALDAYADMDAGRLTGRAVITPVARVGSTQGTGNPSGRIPRFFCPAPVTPCHSFP